MIRQWLRVSHWRLVMYRLNTQKPWNCLIYYKMSKQLGDLLWTLVSHTTTHSFSFISLLEIIKPLNFDY